MNSSAGFAATVDLTPRQSHGALRVALMLHVLPLAAIPFLLDSGWLPLVFAGAIGLSWLTVRRQPTLGFGPRALTRIIAHEDGGWTVEDAAGRRYHASLLRGNLLAGMVILDFGLDKDRRRQRLLLGDEVDEVSMRRLRARLLTRSEAPHRSAGEPR